MTKTKKLYAAWVGRGGPWYSDPVRVRPHKGVGGLWADNGNDNIPGDGPGVYVNALTGVTSLVATSKRDVQLFLLGAASQRDVLATLFRGETPSYADSEAFDRALAGENS